MVCITPLKMAGKSLMEQLVSGVAMRVIADPRLLRRFLAKSKNSTTHPRFSWDILRHSNSLNVW